MIAVFLIMSYLLITIRSFNIIQILLFPFFFHAIWLIYSTFAWTCSFAFIALYYAKLIFDQINDEIEMIYKRSKWFITFANQKRLIWLTYKFKLIIFKHI